MKNVYNTRRHDSRSGVIIEMAIVLMLLALALCAIAVTYATSMINTAGEYDRTTSAKMKADQVAAAYLESTSSKSSELVYIKNQMLKGEYSFVTYHQEDGAGNTLRYYCEVYDYSRVIECVKTFIESPSDFINTTYNLDDSGFSYDYYSENGEFVLGIYKTTGVSQHIFSIYAARQPIYDDATGTYIVGYESGYTAYKIIEYVTSYTLDDATGEVISSTTSEVVYEYSFENMRKFYSEISSPLIYMVIEDGKYIKYQYGEI